MSFLDQINKERLPKHIAIIMDGNGRWAKQRDRERIMGHKQGEETVRKVIEASAQIGVSYLTLYTFSTENWNRPDDEVRALMDLIIRAVVNETPELVKNGIRVLPIGDLGRLPNKTKEALAQCVSDTSKCTRMTVVLALSYSSKWEITEAVKIIAKAAKDGKLEDSDIDEDLLAKHLTTKDFPDPDILIRTGGEKRISNFLLWQIAYSELYFTDTLWPDFDEESLYEAIVDYQYRERRYGKTSEQVEDNQ